MRQSNPSNTHPLALLLDRTAVLFCGVAAGIAIGLAFAPQIEALLGDAPAAVGDVAAPAGPVGADGLPTAVAPAARPPAGLARAVAEHRAFRIGVFGDSFGDGLWAALYNQLPRKQAFQVLRYAEQATGFTRYRQQNLEDKLARQLAEGPVDVAVISFGANDVQGIFVDGRVAPLLSPAWKTEIGARARRYVKALQAQGATVFWVGLPVMRDAGFDRQIRGINAFFAAEMAGLGVTYIDTRGLAVGPDGGYASHLPDKATGTPWLVRAGDGIHMSMKGYRLLTDGLAARIRAWGEAARNGRAVTPDLVPPPVVDAPRPAPAGGQIGDPPETLVSDVAVPLPEAAPAAEPPAADAPTNLLPTLPPAATTPAPGAAPPPQPATAPPQM